MPDNKGFIRYEIQEREAKRREETNMHAFLFLHLLAALLHETDHELVEVKQTGELIMFGFDAPKNASDCDIPLSALQYHGINRSVLTALGDCAPSLRDSGHVLRSTP